MGAVSPRFSGFAVVAFGLLLSGCASLREHAPDSLAALIDRTTPPTRIAGLDYSEIAALGVHGSCDTLAQTLEQKRTLPRRELEGSLLPSCQVEVEEALARERESARLDELIEQGWQALLARRERERQAEERRMLEAELQRRQLQQQQQQEQTEQQAASSRQSRHQEWLQRLSVAAIHSALAELEVPDRALAFSAGQISERSLSNFLACIELAYPNRGYRISRDGRKLVVIAEKAALPRGRMPIEARFTEHDEFWLLTYLKVAEISATTAQDRFILAQNLVAQSCYGEDGLL